MQSVCADSSVVGPLQLDTQALPFRHHSNKINNAAVIWVNSPWFRKIHKKFWVASSIFLSGVHWLCGQAAQQHLGFGGRHRAGSCICIFAYICTKEFSRFCILVFFYFLNFCIFVPSNCADKQQRSSTWVLVAAVGPTRPCHLVAKLRSHGDAGTDHKDV